MLKNKSAMCSTRTYPYSPNRREWNFPERNGCSLIGCGIVWYFRQLNDKSLSLEHWAVFDASDDQIQ